MKSLFGGYFTPSSEEFKRLWDESVFGFDANVLLRLYKSTIETRQVFFETLKRLGERVFLPHQAAAEYLRNRLNVISARSDRYAAVADEADKLVTFVESTLQEHALLNGKGMVAAAKAAADKIRESVETGVKNEPDFLHSDDLLMEIAELFKSGTGKPYEQQRLKEIFAAGAQRYSQRIPPGYKDDKKGDPDKYGDLLIWWQLIDEAKAKGKSIIFVTGDTKEDWWLQHNGETFGPRPELRQEMLELAGFDFYMYTVPKFLEYAKEFLGLQFDTKKAESEFKKIEEQDKQAADRARELPMEVDYAPVSQFSAKYELPANYVSYGYQMNTQWPSYGPRMGWDTAVEEPQAKADYFLLLPISGYVYHSATGKWKCGVVGTPYREDKGHIRYNLKFEAEDRVRDARLLTLRLSLGALERDDDWSYKSAISKLIVEWLGSNQGRGEVTYP